MFGLFSAFFGWSHTGRASFLTGTGTDGLAAALQELGLQVEKGRAQPYASGEVVVDKDIGFKIDFRKIRLGLFHLDGERNAAGRKRFSCGVVANRNAHIMDVAHHEKRGHLVHAVGQAEEAVDLLFGRKGEDMEHF